MASEAVRVVAKVTAQHGKVKDLKAILLGLIGPTRTEKGCVSYQLLQNKTDESNFVFVEEWTSDAAIDNHMTTSHVQDALSKIESMLAQDPDIRRYVIIG